MSALNWHSHEETPDMEFAVAVIAIGNGSVLLDQLYYWAGSGWIGLQNSRYLVVEAFHWAYDVDIANTLKASLGANHV